MSKRIAIQKKMQVCQIQSKELCITIKTHPLLCLKIQYQIPNNLRSCHSAQIGKYTIEGHVPIESIKKLLEEKPLISGLAVPGMPHGSPGMEIHSHESHSHDYESYEVVAFSESGKTKIFDKISP